MARKKKRKKKTICSWQQRGEDSGLLPAASTPLDEQTPSQGTPVSAGIMEMYHLVTAGRGGKESDLYSGASVLVEIIFSFLKAQSCRM